MKYKFIIKDDIEKRNLSTMSCTDLQPDHGIVALEPGNMGYHQRKSVVLWCVHGCYQNPLPAILRSVINSSVVILNLGRRFILYTLFIYFSNYFKSKI